MTSDVTSRRGNAARLKLLQDDLRRLVRTTKRDVKPADFPALLDAGRVRQCAERLGLSLSHSDDFLDVLRSILKERAEEEERAASAERFPSGTADDWRKFRVAEPAIALLGLTRATTMKGREERREEAAKSRGRAKAVTGRTIKNANHEPVIIEEIALLLASDQPLAEDVITVTLETIRNNSSSLDCVELTHGLSKDESRRLAVEFVDSYREFHDELRSLADAARPWSAQADDLERVDLFLERVGTALGLPVSPSPPFNRDDFAQENNRELDDELFFSSLHAFANRRLTNEHLMDFAGDLENMEKDTPTNRFAWLGRVLQALHYHLIAFDLRGWALLSHAAERAAGNYHVFLETMESTQFGCETLRLWAEDLRPQSYDPVKLSNTHFIWLTGLTAARLLVAPRELRDRERHAVICWVLTNGAKEDARQLSNLMREGDARDWLEFSDSQYDTAFLRSCRS